MEYIYIYLAVISVITAAATVLDKSRAKKGKWRVPEATLFILAAFGGSVAEYITMKLIRHKTKHLRFMLGLPCIFILQAVSVTLLYLKFFT